LSYGKYNIVTEVISDNVVIVNGEYVCYNLNLVEIKFFTVTDVSGTYKLTTIRFGY
jgi:hypothetical protein